MRAVVGVADRNHRRVLATPDVMETAEWVQRRRALIRAHAEHGTLPEREREPDQEPERKPEPVPLYRLLSSEE